MMQCQCCTAQCAGIAVAVFAVFLGLLYWDVTTPPRHTDDPTAMDQYVIEVYSDWKWENMVEYYWGDHVHLGYWEDPANEEWSHKTLKANKEKIMVKHLEFGLAAASDSVKRAIASASPDNMLQIFDSGCGIGGASRWLERRFGVGKTNVTGVTITPYQVRRGKEWNVKQGAKNVNLLLGDILKLDEVGIRDNSMDIVWSFESEHHIHNKTQMVKQLMRILKPGGLLILQSLNRRAEPPIEDGTSEGDLMDFIELSSGCPRWSTVPQLKQMFVDAGLTNVGTTDFGPFVGPDWYITLYVGLFDWEQSIFRRWLYGELHIPLSGIRRSMKDFYIAYAYGLGYRGPNPLVQQGLIRGTKAL